MIGGKEYANRRIETYQIIKLIGKERLQKILTKQMIKADSRMN